MASEMKYISNITPETKKWTAKIRVMEKSFPRTAAQTSKKYQRLILIDGQGVRVQATIFGSDIDTLANTLYCLGHYYISNAVVKPIQEQHRLVSNKYQWTISTKSPIYELPENELTEKVISTPFNIVPLSALQEHKGSHSQIDILAAVADIYPTKTLPNGTCQEILIVDHELQPITLTLWDDFVSVEGVHIAQFIDSLPIILATRLRVTSFNDLSLSTRYSTTFIYNPTLPESEALREWLNQNEEAVKEVTHTKSNTLTAPTTQPHAPNVIVTIASLSTNDKNATFWVKANASIKKETRKLWYMGCGICWHGIHAEYNHKFKCRFCNGQERTAQPRCRFSVELTDETASLAVTIFGENAEKLFGLDAVILMQNSDEDGLVDVSKLPTPTTATEKYFMLKLSRKQDDRFIIAKVKADLEEPDSSRQRTH